MSKSFSDLMAETRKRFLVQARVSDDECDSILRLVRSSLDLTLARLRDEGEKSS